MRCFIGHLIQLGLNAGVDQMDGELASGHVGKNRG